MWRARSTPFDVTSAVLPAPGRVRLAALPPLSLYIHIPWCVRKCPYCDFNSHEARGPAPEAAYVDALVADLEGALPQVWGRKIHTIFFGGGTPSLFSAESIDRLMAAIRARLPLEYCEEVTLEANPGTAEAEKFAGFRAAGVNRLSIGIQSFNDRHLKALGRIHDAREAQRAIEFAHRHFENFNLDLMYALPEQMVEEAIADIRQAIAARPAHISAYHLTLEPNTLFYRHPPPLPDDDTAAEMQLAIEGELASAGYVNYETSAFALPGREARHNLNYWRFGDYLGIGAGAAGKISFPDRIVRTLRHKHPRTYLDGVASGAHLLEENEVRVADLPFEFMMNALRLKEGFAFAMFNERTGMPITAVSRELDEAEQRGLLARDHVRAWPTDKGRRFLNDLLQIFLK